MIILWENIENKSEHRKFSYSQPLDMQLWKWQKIFQMNFTHHLSGHRHKDDCQIALPGNRINFCSQNLLLDALQLKTKTKEHMKYWACTLIDHPLLQLTCLNALAWPKCTISKLEKQKTAHSKKCPPDRGWTNAIINKAGLCWGLCSCLKTLT